jgi:hypothetical protein
MDGFPAGGGRLMGFRSRLRGAVIQSAGALGLNELMLTWSQPRRRIPASRQPSWHAGRLARGFHPPARMAAKPVYGLGSASYEFVLGEHRAGAQVCGRLLTLMTVWPATSLLRAPVLESLGMRGLFFVNPGFAQLRGPAARDFFLDRLAVDRNQPYAPEEWTPMTPAQIAELACRGHAIGNHTFSHADLSRADSGRLRHEIVHSRDVLSQWTGRAVECFTWTYKWNAISREAWDMARSRHRFCFAPCAGLTSRAAGHPDLIWRTHVESAYLESEYRFIYSGLAAIPAWFKRRRLDINSSVRKRLYSIRQERSVSGCSKRRPSGPERLEKGLRVRELRRIRRSAASFAFWR